MHKSQRKKNERIAPKQIVFVGGVPRTGQNAQGKTIPMDPSLFSQWALSTFPGQLHSAKLRTDQRNQSLGYGFLTFKCAESAKIIISKGRAAFNSTFVDIKATAKRQAVFASNDPDSHLSLVSVCVFFFHLQITGNSANWEVVMMILRGLDGLDFVEIANNLAWNRLLIHLRRTFVHSNPYYQPPL
jgi:hypothetical protein